MAGTHDERETPRAGDRVGLGRVVEAGAPRSDARGDDVEEGSAESFPASDPPAYTGARPAPADADATAPPAEAATTDGRPAIGAGREGVELPDPRDVP
ncbi:MAG: hypothetical protein ACJ77C_14000 [Chloroflexota bacterium]